MPTYDDERVHEICSVLADAELRGVSVTELAREQEVSAGTVYRWRKRFGFEGPDADIVATKQSIHADLVEVRSPFAGDHRLEISIGDVTLRVPTGLDSDELSRVLGAVRSC